MGGACGIGTSSYGKRSFLIRMRHTAERKSARGSRYIDAFPVVLDAGMRKQLPKA